MASRGRCVGVWVLVVVVCCGLVNGLTPKPRKRVERPPPRRRVKTIVAELEKNVSALWTRVDQLSQPVHVHVHGDSHLMPHPHHHPYHHPQQHDQPCPPQGAEDGPSDLMRSSVEPKVEGSGGPVIDKDYGVKLSLECLQRCRHKFRHADDLINAGVDDVSSKDDDDNDEVKLARECLQRCRDLNPHLSFRPLNDSPRHPHAQPHPNPQQQRPLHRHRPLRQSSPTRGHEPHHHEHHAQYRHLQHEAEKEGGMGPGAVHSGPRGTHVHIHLHTGDLPQSRPLPRQNLPPEPAKEYRYACCVVYPGRPAPNVEGTIMFRQMPGQPVEIKVDMRGMPIDMAQDQSVRYLRGMHAHEYGDVTDHCARQGGHYNPHDVNHGGPSAAVRHPGDFGNLVLGRDGRVVASFNDSRASLFGHFSMLGRGLVIHEGADDLGLRDTAASRRSGDAGGRAACCAVLACPAPKGVWDI